jgi:hypothetical protein
MQRLTPYIGADAMRRTPIIHTLRSDGTYTTAAALASDTGATPTFARNCVAYRDYWDGATRKLASVAANVPRWCTRKDAGGVLRSGLLVGPSTTNLAIYNKTFAEWLLVRCTKGGSASTAPDGSAMIDLIETSEASPFFYYTATSVPAGVYQLSCFAKKDTRNGLRMKLHLGGTVYVQCFYNLDTGTVGTSTDALSTGIEDWGGGKFRCWLSGNVLAGDLSAQLLAAVDENISYTVSSGTKALALWGAQFCINGIGGPLPLISTANVPATELGDALFYDVTGRIGQRGSLVFSIMFPDHDLSANVVPVCLHDGTANNRITCNILAAGDKASATVVSGGDTQADITDATTDVVDGDKHTIAISWEPNSIKLYVDGTLEGTADTEATIPSGITTLTLGDHDGANQPNAMISDLKIYNRPGVTS